MMAKFFDEFSMSFGLIQGSAEQAANCFFSWQKVILSKIDLAVDLERRFCDLRRLLDDLYPLTGPIATRYVFWQLSDEWVLFLDNEYTGMDAGALRILSERLNVDAVRVVMERGLVATATGRAINYPATIFEYYSGGVQRRSVYSAFDGARWEFGQSGELMAFEGCNDYKSKSIKNRLTPLVLVEYLRALGLDLQKISTIGGDAKIGYFLQKRAGVTRSLPVSVECSKAMNLSLNSLWN